MLQRVKNRILGMAALAMLLWPVAASAQSAAQVFAKQIDPYVGRRFVCNQAYSRSYTHFLIERADANTYKIRYWWKNEEVREDEIMFSGDMVTAKMPYSGSDPAHLQIFPRGFRMFKLLPKNIYTYNNTFMILDDPDHIRVAMYFSEQTLSGYQLCDAVSPRGELIKISKQDARATAGDFAKLGPMLGAVPQFELSQDIANQLEMAEPQKKKGGGVLGALASIVTLPFRMFEAYDGSPVSAGNTAWQPSTSGQWAGQIQSASPGIGDMGGTASRAAPRMNAQQQAQQDELERYKIRERMYGKRSGGVDGGSGASGATSGSSTTTQAAEEAPPADGEPCKRSWSWNAEAGCMVRYDLSYGFVGKTSMATCYSPVISTLLPAGWKRDDDYDAFYEHIAFEIRRFKRDCRSRMPADTVWAADDRVQIRYDMNNRDERFARKPGQDDIRGSP